MTKLKKTRKREKSQTDEGKETFSVGRKHRTPSVKSSEKTEFLGLDLIWISVYMFYVQPWLLFKGRGCGLIRFCLDVFAVFEKNRALDPTADEKENNCGQLEKLPRIVTKGDVSSYPGKADNYEMPFARWFTNSNGDYFVVTIPMLS